MVSHSFILFLLIGEWFNTKSQQAVKVKSRLVVCLRNLAVKISLPHTSGLSWESPVCESWVDFSGTPRQH